ncbi:MAG TPA: tetratricopeptide repeat protein [Patescibacteria group bacterium]|nr:tetratricopeptide repeat protein [Patescibacteria group bacterium]
MSRHRRCAFLPVAVLATGLLLLAGCPAGNPSGPAPAGRTRGAEVAGSTEGAAEAGGPSPGGLDAAGGSPVENGVRLTREGDLEAAEPLLLEAVRRNPNDTRALDALGYVYGHTDRWRKAEETYRRILGLSPASPGALYGLATTLADVGRVDEALVVTEEMLAHDPANRNARLYEATLYGRLGRNAEAATSARAVIAADAGNVEAFYVLGSALQDGGDFAGAVSALETVVAKEPLHVGALSRLAALYTRLGRAQDAARAREAHDTALARQRVEERVRGHRVKGVAAFNRGDYPAALSEFEIISREDPKDPQAYLMTGSSLIALSRFDEAGRALDRSLALQPRNERTLLELGRLLALQDRLDEAVRAIGRSIEVNPEFAEPHYFLAGILTARGDPDGARREMQRFEELKARSPGAALELAGPPQAVPR